MSDVTVQDEPARKSGSALAETKLGGASVAQAGGGVPAPLSGSTSLTPGTTAGAPGKTLSGECHFNDNITILMGNRLPHLDKGPVKAFAARGTDKAPANLFAMICEEQLTPRTMKAPNYASIMNQSLARLVASGAVEWSPAGKEKYCLIYEDTLGNPLMREDTRGGLGLKPEAVLNGVIRPVVTVLQDMRDRDLIHGNIRLSNMFDGNGRGLERVVLGECLSTPVSYNQPSLYEPVERALASATGRGTGNQADDLYSFGVCLALLMRHYDPNEGLSDEEIIERKMDEGSYLTLLGKDRFSGAILELLRGLLYDDENQRWTLDEVLIWLDGRRLSPKQSSRRNKASRPLVFNGEKYIRPELIARDLNKNPAEARQIIESGDLEQWLSRALEDKPTIARYETALKLAEEGGKGPGFTERLITRVSVALHPEGPIRYKSINIFPDSIGPALVEAFVMKRDLAAWTDFFMAYFITQWIDSQSSTVPDVSSVISKFDGARAYLRQKGFGGGLEKCLYLLNPEVHCLSEKLAKYHVRTPEDMMDAFERLSKSPGRPTMFFDRHIIAFLSIKDRKNIDTFLYDLNAPEPYRRILAEMRTLATIQRRSQIGPFPGIAAWMVDNLGPVYERFHDRELRIELKKKAERLQDSGDLPKLLALFDTPAVYQEDNLNFRKSMRKYHDLEQETLQIERDLRDESNFGRDTGRQIASVVAGILAGIIILVTFFTAGG